MNIVDKKGFTPLITATQFGHVALVAYLVGRGARLECEDLNGDNSLHWVIQSNFSLSSLNQNINLHVFKFKRRFLKVSSSTKIFMQRIVRKKNIRVLFNSA